MDAQGCGSLGVAEVGLHIFDVAAVLDEVG